MLKQTFDPLHKSQVTLLNVTGLCGGPGDTALFSDLNFQLPPGVSVLLGDEGQGKTSLMRLLSGDLPATAGQLRLKSEPPLLKRPQPSVVFWVDLRMPSHDTDTPAQCWAQLRAVLPAWSEAVQNQLTEALNLTPHLDKKLNMLSTGSRRKVGLVAALASGATVTLLDQPFVSLDAASIHALLVFLATLDPQLGRAWLIADYVKPDLVPLVSVIQL